MVEAKYKITIDELEIEIIHNEAEKLYDDLKKLLGKNDVINISYPTYIKPPERLFYEDKTEYTKFQPTCKE